MNPMNPSNFSINNNLEPDLENQIAKYESQPVRFWNGHRVEKLKTFAKISVLLGLFTALVGSILFDPDFTDITTNNPTAYSAGKFLIIGGLSLTVTSCFILCLTCCCSDSTNDFDINRQLADANYSPITL